MLSAAQTALLGTVKAMPSMELGLIGAPPEGVADDWGETRIPFGNDKQRLERQTKEATTEKRRALEEKYRSLSTATLRAFGRDEVLWRAGAVAERTIFDRNCTAAVEAARVATFAGCVRLNNRKVPKIL
jgi:hypothetical protein